MIDESQPTEDAGSTPTEGEASGTVSPRPDAASSEPSSSEGCPSGAAEEQAAGTPPPPACSDAAGDAQAPADAQPCAAAPVPPTSEPVSTVVEATAPGPDGATAPAADGATAAATAGVPPPGPSDTPAAAATDGGSPIPLGTTVRGILGAVDGEDFLVTLESGQVARMRRTEFADVENNIVANEGDAVEAVVSSFGDDLRLRKTASPRLQALATIADHFTSRTPVEGRVMNAIKGGLEVKIEGLRAFCPGSQAGLPRGESAEALVGQTMPFLVTKFDASGRSLVVSRRKLVDKEQRRSAAATKGKVTKGAKLRGRVLSFQEYGAFVDLGGVHGLLHVSEISHSRIERPEDVLTIGEHVEVEVLKHDESCKKVSLSMKALSADPWKAFKETTQVGQVVRARVLRIGRPGAMVELTRGVLGLLSAEDVQDLLTAPPEPEAAAAPAAEAPAPLAETAAPAAEAAAPGAEAPAPAAEAPAPAAEAPAPAAEAPAPAAEAPAPAAEAPAPAAEAPAPAASARRPAASSSKRAASQPQAIDVHVVDLDAGHHRVSLRRAPAGASPGDVVAVPGLQAGSRVNGTAERTAPFGVFVRLPGGKVGLLHASESNTPPGTDLAQAFPAGLSLAVEVLEVSPDGSRIRLTCRSAADRAPRPAAPGRDDGQDAEQRGRGGPREGRREGGGFGGGSGGGYGGGPGGAFGSGGQGGGPGGGRGRGRSEGGRGEGRGGGGDRRDRPGGGDRRGPRESTQNPAAAPSRGFASFADALADRRRAMEEAEAEAASDSSSADGQS